MAYAERSLATFDPVSANAALPQSAQASAMSMRFISTPYTVPTPTSISHGPMKPPSAS